MNEQMLCNQIGIRLVLLALVVMATTTLVLPLDVDDHSTIREIL